MSSRGCFCFVQKMSEQFGISKLESLTSPPTIFTSDAPHGRNGLDGQYRDVDNLERVKATAQSGVRDHLVVKNKTLNFYLAFVACLLTACAPVLGTRVLNNTGHE